jgi:solute:Na+ symporter, SSS family
MNTAVLLGIGCYLVLMLAVGYVASRRVKSFSDFLVAGRRLGYPLATATLFATWFGAGTCMGGAGAAYSEGLPGVIADPFAAGVSLILAGIFYVHLLRRLNLMTVTDVFGKFYGKDTEIFASLLMMPVYIGWLGSQMVAIGYIINSLTGLNPQLGITIGTAVVLIYTYAGGMWAVTLTDAIQAAILVLGLFLLFGMTLHHIGGVDSLIQATPTSFWRMTPENASWKDWVSYGGQWAMCGLGCIVGQDLVQRSLSSKAESVARKSALTAGVLYISVGMIPILLGFSGRIVFSELVDPEHVIPQLAMHFLPPFTLTIFLSASISMIMSSADSSLLAGSSLVTHNIVLRIWPRFREKKALPLARMVTAVLAILSMGVALYAKKIYSLMVNSWATLLVGILVPVTFALYSKRASRQACWVSMLIGTTVWLGDLFFEAGLFAEVSDALFYRAAVYGGVASLVSYVFVAWIWTPKSSSPEIKEASILASI